MLRTRVIASTPAAPPRPRAGAPAPLPTAAPPSLTTGRLAQIDLVRVLTFTAVISVHAIAFTASNSSRIAGAALMLLQFGREVFFAMTAFVLVYTARPGERARAFWRRRFPYVAAPYVAWTLVYEVVRTGPFSVRTFGADLLTGGAKYHLYFLLVTMQLYFAFPVLVRFLRATARHAWRILAGTAVVNGLWLAILQYGQAPSGPANFLWTHAYALLPSYTLCVFAGGYAALHLPRVQDVLARRGRTLVIAALATAAAAVVAYVVQLRWYAPRHADAVLQPAMLLTSVAAAVLLYVAGSRWAAAGRPADKLGHKIVNEASDLSFGVYLAHPLVLGWLISLGLGPTPVSTALAIVGCAAGATAITWVARRTPLSLALTGRRK